MKLRIQTFCVGGGVQATVIDVLAIRVHLFLCQRRGREEDDEKRRTEDGFRGVGEVLEMVMK